MRKEKEYRRSRWYVLSSAFLVLAVGLCLFASVQVMTKGYVSIGGYSVFRVVTGSMEPTIPTGALLLNRETDIREIETDDIVCFWAKAAEIRGTVITHRVTKTVTDEGGYIYLETRGDANLASDPYYVDETNLIGRVCRYSKEENLLTRMLSFLSGKIGFFACIVFPLLLTAGLILKSAVSNLQKDLYRLRQELERGAAEAGENEGTEEAKEKSGFLPGYRTLTYEDYEAVYQAVLDALRRELTESEPADS